MLDHKERKVPNFNEAYADKLVALFRSDLWKIIKGRNAQYVKILEERALNSMHTGNEDAKLYANQALGAKLAVEISERIPSELTKGTLAADVLLGVIENKPVKPKEKSWLNQILARLWNRK